MTASLPHSTVFQWPKTGRGYRNVSVATKPPRYIKFICQSAERETRTPHSGYHYDSSPRRFFEGWYFKVSIPSVKQSFAWMYSIEDPEPSDPPLLSAIQWPPLVNQKFPGVGAQVMGADGKYLWQHEDRTEGFWGSRHELELGYTYKKKGSTQGSNPKGMVDPGSFSNLVEEGFQVSPTLHQGRLLDNKRSAEISETVSSVAWEYTTRPIYGWGPLGGTQRATAGWLAAFQVFEPHWQVCMAGGLSTGWIEWGDQRFDFVDAPSYVEKNWGGSFPEKWFWVQCNVFEGVEGEMALTAGGGRRSLPIVPFGAPLVEEVAMIGVHYKGEFYEFVPWTGEVSWEISQWGRWKMGGRSKDYEVELLATTEDSGVVLRAPTKDYGLSPLCKDSFFGDLELCIWERTSSGKRGEVVVKTSSSMAALEVGGGPWWSTWRNRSEIVAPFNEILGLPIDVGSLISDPLKPPGL